MEISITEQDLERLAGAAIMKHVPALRDRIMEAISTEEAKAVMLQGAAHSLSGIIEQAISGFATDPKTIIPPEQRPTNKGSSKKKLIEFPFKTHPPDGQQEIQSE